MAGGVDWSLVTGFHRDEYVALPADHPAGFGRYVREAECDRYAALLQSHPLDLGCLGIGENGHLAFNDPPVADFDDPADVKIVELDDSCRHQQVGERHFPDVGAVPTHALTVTTTLYLDRESVGLLSARPHPSEP
jgi:glucosamine-6-phosphate deaminase